MKRLKYLRKEENKLAYTKNISKYKKHKEDRIIKGHLINV